jgi:hypothetical protein
MHRKEREEDEIQIWEKHGEEPYYKFASLKALKTKDKT